ncbi:MAG TPA: hypothetical protein VFH04_04145 [Nitrososphaeraceae archaeon]|nr:hypothetical protein [Nitrososphaeraceae archaeon]
MVVIETTCSLESFRKFIIVSTCRSFIPESYLKDYEVFPEREEGPGAIYIEAADKVTLKRIREMTFVNAKEILGIIYSSKSGNTRLKWRQTRKKIGKVQGEASSNALVNLVESGVLTQEWVDDYLRASQSRRTSEKVDQSIVSSEHTSQATSSTPPPSTPPPSTTSSVRPTTSQ